MHCHLGCEGVTLSIPAGLIQPFVTCHPWQLVQNILGCSINRSFSWLRHGRRGQRLFISRQMEFSPPVRSAKVQADHLAPTDGLQRPVRGELLWTCDISWLCHVTTGKSHFGCATAVLVDSCLVWIVGQVARAKTMA